MKIASLYGIRDIRIEEGSDAEPGPGQVLLDVTAVGICGSDLHTYMYGNVGGTVSEGPFTLGHEAAGRVLAVGAGVTGLKVGDRVAIDPATPCESCERCLAGEPHLCLNMVFMGLWPHHGALRERMVHAAKSCVPIPTGISDTSIALLEPLGVALHASRLAQVQLGEDVAVIGCGGIGLLLIRLARLAGAGRIFAIDRHAWRLHQAAQFGADVVYNADETDVVTEIMRATHTRGVDLALEAAWVADTTNICVEIARFGGRVIIVGIPVEDSVTFKASAARRKELLIQHSRRMKHTYPVSIQLALSKQVNLDALATHHFGLEQTREAFEIAGLYQDGVVRALVLPNHQHG
jgi:L-iditol 2-dehydrogenase